MNAGRDDEAFEEAPQRPRQAGPPPLDDEGIQGGLGGAAPPARSQQERRERDDEDDNRPRRRRPARHPDEPRDDALSSIIPYRNGMALAAYYLGVFSLIPLIGGLLSPIALIFGILGLRAVSQNPAAKGTGHAITGIILGSLSLLGHLGLLILIVIGASR